MTLTEQTRKIEQYITNVGTFFKKQSGDGYWTLDTLLINDKLCNQYLKYNGYFKIDEPIKNIKQKVSGKTQQVGWELINPELACSILPMYLTLEQLYNEYNVDSEHDGYAGEYKDRAAMYKPVTETTESSYVDVPFELITLGELQVDNYNKPEAMLITQQVESTYGRNNLQTLDLSAIVQYGDITRILTPEFMLHTQPCSLSSNQVYSIVRHWIKEHIDPKVAKITSDYDFCFTVKKIVKTEPFIKRVEKLTRGFNSYNPKRYENKKEDTILVDIFEMTYAGYKGNAGYDGYTCIPKWEAKSLKDMQEHIKNYLDNLMSVINSNLHQCECCKGSGYRVESAMNVKR